MEDLTGRRFFNLTVIEDPLSSSKKCLCRCDCGKTAYVIRYHLLDSHTKSCGCRHQKYRITNKRVYSIWSNMIDRCKSSKRRDAKNYYLKGVRVCSSWKFYDNFEKWALANGYAYNLTIDRIDFNGDYEPSNCRWITIQEQQRNKETTTFYTYNGETRCLQEWAEVTGINHGTLWSRIHSEGLSIGEAINKKKKQQRTNVLITYEGETYNLSEFGRKYGYNNTTLSKYLKKGMTLEEIMSNPNLKKEKYKASTLSVSEEPLTVRSE